MTARLSYLNLFARDIGVQARFYAAALDMAEVTALRSPIFRCLDAGGVLLGFSAHAAYELPNLADRVPERPVTTAYATFELESTAAVDAGVKRVQDLGDALIKAPYRTYYNAY